MYKFLISTFLIITSTDAFPTDSLTGKAAHTRSHKEITKTGIRVAIGKYLTDRSMVDPTVTGVYLAVNTFFGEDADGLEEYNRRLDQIVVAVNRQEPSSLAYIHCNAEQIEMAHNYIINQRNQIHELAQTTNPDLSLIRENIGRCLYTIQAFYSTTNWVEMDGERTYRDFGVPGKTLMSIAGSGVDTCKNCDNSGTDETSCQNNLLVMDKLTSGYHSGQDENPPYKTNTDYTRGKCGFGGSSDKLNGQYTARGGINKDRTVSTYSPHHHLHTKAYLAARQATEDFIIDSEIGIINELQSDLFEEVFNLKRRDPSSFGFTIDVTGSMGDDIAKVKKGCEEFVTDVQDTPNEPMDYVLVTFSDPAILTTHVLTTSNGFEMASTINNLTVWGGWDCPEYAIDGLLKCVESCRSNSTIFFFSDAPAKDEENRTIVTDAIKAKNIDLRIILTPLCGTIAKRDVDGRYKRQTGGSSVYFEIAEETGGQVYQVNTSDIVSIMQHIAEDAFPSATGIIDMFSMETTSTSTMTFPVDNAVVKLKIEIIGNLSVGSVDIILSSVSVLASSNTTDLYQGSDKRIITVISPTPGEYTLQSIGGAYIDVNVTAQTKVDFSYALMEEKHDNFYHVSSNPILGQTYTMFITVYNLPSTASVTTLVFRSSNGTENHLPLTNLDSTLESSWSTSVVFTSESYQVGIMGTDETRHTWIRTSAFKIHPVDVLLTVSAVPNLYAGITANVSYLIDNYGSEDETFIVSVFDNRGSIAGQSLFSHMISPASNQSVVFGIVGSSIYNTVTYTIRVSKSGSSLVLQEDKKTIFVTQQVPPTCDVNVLNGNCGYNGSCNSESWNSQATITFTVPLSSITGSNGLNYVATDMLTSPVQVDVSGDCCLPSAYLNVIDVNSNIIRCHFYLGEVPYSPESKSELSSEEKVAIGIIVPVVVVSILIVVIITIFVLRGALKKKSKERKINGLKTDKLPCVFANVPPKGTAMDHLHIENFD